MVGLLTVHGSLVVKSCTAFTRTHNVGLLTGGVVNIQLTIRFAGSPVFAHQTDVKLMWSIGFGESMKGSTSPARQQVLGVSHHFR